MELKEGLMTFRQLSTWFGLKPDAITKGTASARAKKFDKLKNFCDFHLEGKKLIIDRVIIPEYIKAYDCIEENFDNEWGLVIDRKTYQANWQKVAMVDTVTRVGKAIHQKYPEVQQIAESSAISYTGQIKRRKVGRNCVEEHGEEGFCYTVFLNEDGSNLLSNEQMEILRQCRKDAYSSINDQLAEIDEALAMRDISQEEAKHLKGEIDTTKNYIQYQNLLQERLGFIPKKRTKIVHGVNFD